MAKKKAKSIVEVNAQLARIRRLNTDIFTNGSRQGGWNKDLVNVAEDQYEKAQRIAETYKKNIKAAIQKDNNLPKMVIGKQYSHSVRAGITG